MYASSTLALAAAPMEDRLFDDTLFEARTIVLGSPLTEAAATDAVARLTAMGRASDAPVTVVVRAREGAVEAGMALYDAVRFVGSRVRVLASGFLGLAGALVCAAPEDAADRLALPNSRFDLRFPRKAPAGAGDDVTEAAEQHRAVRERAAHLLAATTGRAPGDVSGDLQAGLHLSALEAVAYGLVGRVVTHADEMP